MSSRIHDRGKRLQFGKGKGSPTPTFRHPYEKYGSRVSKDSVRHAGECDPGKSPDSSDLTRKRSFKNGQNGLKNGRKGLEERNALICQTFLTENPFFGAYYPAIRPRSVDGLSNKGSDRSRSPSTDFDDSKTYKIIYTGDSACNEDHDSLQGSKSKKTDDIHHFHEHHHFFHDKNGECSNPTYYDKYQYVKAKEQSKSSVANPNKSFLKQPIQESCMIYQVEEDRNQRLEPREPRKEKSQEGTRHLSRSSSKSGKRSSGNETYTVVCEHCQKLLRDHPNARIVGHENIPERLPSESYERRSYGYSYDPLPKASWKPTNFFVVEPQHQVQRLNVSEENAQWRQRKPFVPFNVGSWPEKSRENVLPKVPSHESSITDSDSRSLIFKCDHCKSIIETKSRTRERTEDTSSSGSVEGRGRLNEKSGRIKSVSKGNLRGKLQTKSSAGTKRSSAVSEKKSSGYKALKSSRTLVKKASSSQRVSGKVSSQKLSKSYTLSDKKKSSLQRTSRPSRVVDKSRSSGSKGSKEPNGAEKRSSSYSTTRDTNLANGTQSSKYKERRASSEMSKRNGARSKGLREYSASGKRISSGFKESKDTNESRQKSSIYKEPSMGKKVGSSIKTSRESARVDGGSSYKRSIATDKRTCSTYTELGNTCSMVTRPSSNRKESKDSTVKRSEKTEPSLKKFESEKPRLVQTEDRSMQTSSRKLILPDQESAEPKRSSTASKSLSRNPSTKESRKSGTAPGSLLNNGSVDPHVKSSATRGSSKISRKTIVSEESRKSGTAPGSLLNNGSVDPHVKSSATRGSSKISRKTIVSEESRKSGTAPGSLLNNGSIDSHVKSSTARGSATISRRSTASKDPPVIDVENTTEAKQSLRITSIQTEITDLKTHLDRLEALHNMKTEDSGSNAVHEAIDCPKHPIVVCTSTTYIMTKCPNDFGDRKTSAASPPREPEKVPAKEKEPERKSSGAEEATASKCQRSCCSELNPPQRKGAASAEKTTNPRYCPGNEFPTFKAGPSRGNCQFVGARITRAINKVCHCPNRDFLSRYCDTPGRTKSCDRDDTRRRLFGNGKNQRRAWLRRGLFTSYCNARGRKTLRCCPECYNIAVADVKNSVHRSYSDGVGTSERLIAYESYGKVLRDYKPHTISQGRDPQKERSKSQSSRNDVQIDDTSRPGYFLRTSISDICEYRNGSLIRLIGKSGWVVYTKKLFLEGKDTRKNESGGEHPKNFDEFAMFPASTTSTFSRSVTNVDKPEHTSDVTRDSRSLIFLNRRQVWSDSSIYLPLALRALQLRSVHTERERSTSSVYLGGNVRIQNRGISNFGEIIETGSNFPNELYLLDCKSAAHKNATCADDIGNGPRCTCRRRRRKTREGGGSAKEKVSVVFERTKPERGGSVEERYSSDVSVKYVFAEKSRDSERANRVIWSTDCNGSRIRRPYLFGVSKGKRNRRNREHFSMNDKQRKHRWHRSTSQKKKESGHGTNKPEGDSSQNRCACCNCSPNHACSQACEREEEELTRIRKLLKNIGITGLTLGFSRKAPYCRTGFFRNQNTEEGKNGSQNANCCEELQTEEKGEVEVTEEVIKDEVGSSVTYLKKVSVEDRCCDCAKQLEQLLNQVELCKQLPVETISLKQESWEEDWNVESRKDSEESTKKKPSLNPDVLDDISLQRRRITECENLLRQFEIQLEDVRRQNEAYICKCEETPRQEVPQRREESRPASQDRLQDATPYAVQNDEVELQVLAERKCPIAKDDGYIRFEGKILTQLTSKRSTKSIGCGAANEEYTRPSSPVHAARKTCMVKNATQMTSDIFVRQRNPESEHFIKEINLDEEELCSAKKMSEDCVHTCCVSAPKIEICCERTMCTCEKCCNIHFVNKHYLPASSFRKWHGHDSENKVEAATYVPRSRNEIFTNTSEQGRFPSKRDECTSIRDLPRSKRTEEISTGNKPRKEEVTTAEYRPTKKDESTWTSHRSRKDEGTSAIRRTKKDEVTSTVSRGKRDEATSTMCKPRKEASVGKAKREEALCHKETPRVKVESVPVKAPSKPVKDEERCPARDEIPVSDRSRCRKESESVSEEERFVNQSDLEKTPSEEENGDESSSKDLSLVSFVKPRAREVICDCSKSSATEKCEDNAKCDCASKGIQCAERRKMKKFCECGSKLKLIEDRLRALEERKRKSESTISSPKERKEATEESSVVSEKIPENTPSESSVVPEKDEEEEVVSVAVSSSKTPEKETSEESSVSYPKEKQLSEQESDASPEEVPSVRVEAEKAEIETTESSTLTEKSSSLENIESETDTEIKTKVITCHNMNFFDGGDPNVKTKCQCMEDSFCPFKQFHNKQDLASAKNIFFVTNIDLLRQWSGMYGCGEYSYCKHFWNVHESALKPVKLPRDWRNVKTAVASFFRSCKFGKKKFTFKRGKKSDGESSANSAASRSDVVASGSGDSFLDDCSRSSMPLKRRSFHVLARGPPPTRPAKERGKTGSDKKKRKRSRKRKIRS